MPTYQYACTECDHTFEQFQSFHDDSLTVCPACAGRLRKVFNAVGVVFKGSGFYRTDSRAGEVTAGAGSSNGSSDSSSATKSEGTDTKTKTSAGPTPATTSGSSSASSSDAGSSTKASGSAA